MPIDWSNTVAQNYHILNKRGIVSELIGVMSQESIDFVYYPGDTYRDEIDAAFMGSPHTLAGDTTGPTAAVVFTNGEQANLTVSGGTFTYAAVSDPHFEESDSFTHTAPRPLEITRTKLIWWSAAGGTGNVVGEGWRDVVEELMPAPFDRI